METRKITVSSYNIHSCKGLDGKCDPSRISRVIAELDVSILGLQEVHSTPQGEIDTSQLHYLAGAMGAAVIAGPTVTRNGVHYGNALLTRLPILEERHLDLTFRRREPRAAIDVILDVHGIPVQVIVTHLGLRTRERLFQVKKLIERFHVNYPTILLGDINEWLPLARPLWWMKQHFGHFKGLKTFPSFLPIFSLDRIWVRPKEALVDISVHHSKTARVASDHLPLKATLNLAV